MKEWTESGRKSRKTKSTKQRFSSFWTSAHLIHKAFIRSDTHCACGCTCFYQHRSIHAETYCRSFHLKSHCETGGGGESISAERVENTSNKQEADDKLIFEHQNTWTQQWTEVITFKHTVWLFMWLDVFWWRWSQANWGCIPKYCINSVSQALCHANLPKSTW